MEYERDQEDAAAEEAASIGGGRDEDLDYVEEDSRPAGVDREAWRAVEEGGGGEAEGFEEAEAELIERAENPHGPSPIADAEGWDEEEAALDQDYGEADSEYTSEDEPGDSDR